MHILSGYSPQGFTTCSYEKYAFSVRIVKMSLLKPSVLETNTVKPIGKLATFNH